MVDPTPFTRKAPPLTDIAGSLRALADRVDSGEIEAESIVIVWPDADRIVCGAFYGELVDRFRLIGILKAASDKASRGAWG